MSAFIISSGQVTTQNKKYNNNDINNEYNNFINDNSDIKNKEDFNL